MKIKDIIQDSTLGLTAYLTNDNIADFISYLIYNKDIVEQFSNMVLAVNSDEEDLSYIKNILASYLEDIDTIFLDQNRGHMFGTMDLDEAVLAASKSSPEKYLFKISQDVIIDKELLETTIKEDIDFFFVPGFSYETILKNETWEKLYKIFENQNTDHKNFTPQSNFFIVNKNIPNLYGGNQVITEYYTKFQHILVNKPNAKCWEEFTNPKFDCETFLGLTINKQSLKTQNLLNEKEFKALWTNINTYKIGDPSHKNIMLPCGVCHFQWKNQPITKIKRPS